MGKSEKGKRTTFVTWQNANFRPLPLGQHQQQRNAKWRQQLSYGVRKWTADVSFSCEEGAEAESCELGAEAVSVAEAGLSVVHLPARESLLILRALAEDVDG